MKIVCISDTHGLHHNMHHEIPDGDVLIHAGDMSEGKMPEVREFNEWLGTLPHKHKLVVAGNHDFSFQRDPADSIQALSNAVYLQDRTFVIGNVQFYGSPWQPWFWDWAFNFPKDELSTGETARATWRDVPNGTDVLITHGPPRGMHDNIEWPPGSGEFQRPGCPFLGERISTLTTLKAHVFGHIHEGYGQSEISGLKFINASICDAKYRPANAPIVFTLDK